METIEERAYKFYSGDGCPADCKNFEFRTDCSDIDNVQAFIDGAYSEHYQLSKWNNLEEEKPEYDKPVLVKLNRVIDGGIYVVARYDIFDEKNRLFRECSGLCRHILDEDIAGWREIHE